MLIPCPQMPKIFLNRGSISGSDVNFIVEGMGLAWSHSQVASQCIAIWLPEEVDSEIQVSSAQRTMLRLRWHRKMKGMESRCCEAAVLPRYLSITEIILGQGQISRGLDMAIGSMREKEEALIRLSASYAPKNRISEDATFKLEVLKFDLLDASSLHRGPTGLRLFQRTLSVAAMEEVVIGSTQAPGGIGQLQMELKTDGKGCYRMLMIGLGHA
eukprot:s1396_g4.t3